MIPSSAVEWLARWRAADPQVRRRALIAWVVLGRTRRRRAAVQIARRLR